MESPLLTFSCSPVRVLHYWHLGLIYPVIPEKSKEVFSYLGINLDFDLTFGQLKPNTEISKPKNLFPRIDTD